MTVIKDNANPIILQPTTTEQLESYRKSLLYKRLCQNELLDEQQQNDSTTTTTNGSTNTVLRLSEWDKTINSFFGSSIIDNNNTTDNLASTSSIEDYVSLHTLRDIVGTTNNHTDDTTDSSPVSILQHIGIWDEIVHSSSSTNNDIYNTQESNNNNNDKDTMNRSIFYNTNDPLDCINIFSSTSNFKHNLVKKQQRVFVTNNKISRISNEEIYEIIRTIQDPEHPLTLEQLGVVSLQQIHITYSNNNTNIKVYFTPTIPHCSMATLIGLCIRVKLVRSLTSTKTKVTIKIQPGTHNSEHAINKQLNDKERVYAAIENNHLLSVVNNCIRNSK
jgi:metal-sulfur cluster biosynthetic enzyme